MKKMRNVLAMILAVLFCILFGVMVQAQEEDRMPGLLDGMTGSLQITMTAINEADEQETLSGVALELFFVAEVKAEGGSAVYTLTEEFAGSGLSFAGMSASLSNTYALALSELADNNSLTGEKSTTGENGQALYTDLKPGMYLVRQAKTAQETDLYVKMEPFLIAVPAIEKDGENHWQYEVQTQPKTAVTIREPQEEKNGSISVEKRVEFLDEDGNQRLVAEDAVFYVGIFTDSEGTKLYGSTYVKPLHLIDKSSETVTFENLPFGEYYVFETDSMGNPLAPAQSILGNDGKYVCLFDDDQQDVTLSAEHDKGEIRLANVYLDVPNGYYMPATIRIEKQVQDGTKQITTQERFFAGIFSMEEDGEYQLLQVVELKQNDTVEVHVPGVSTAGEEMEYWIFETDEDGNLLDPDSFGYLIDGETSVLFGEKHLEETVTLVNTRKTTNEPTPAKPSPVEPSPAEPSPTEAAVTTPAPGTNNPGTIAEDVKTSDETQPQSYIILLICAGLLGLSALIQKKKHR